MKRQRFVNSLLAVACVLMTGVTLHQYSVPIVPAADAQEDGETDAPQGFGDMKPATAAVRKATTAAILAQLQAFAKNDYQTAVKYQSHNLRTHFASVPQFQQMITTAYPEFAHYKSVKFLGVRSDTRSDHAMVEVMLTGQDGKTISAVYLMVREGSAYRVDGVSGGIPPPRLLVPGPAVDA